MKIAIVGAGIVGVTSAYWLARAGHDIDLFDSAAQAGEGVSAGNGGQLSYSYADPMNGPDLWKSLPSIFFGRDSAIGVEMSFDPFFVSWVLRFLMACRRRSSEESLRHLLSLAQESKRELEALLESENINFDYARAGKIVLYKNRNELERSFRIIEIKRCAGIELEILDELACRRLEPALADYPRSFAGGLYAPHDSVGDCAAFARALLRKGESRYGIRFHKEMEVTGFLSDRSHIKGVMTSRGDFPAEAVLLAAGARSSNLLRKVGLDLPIYPVKGYSVTAPLGSLSPSISLTDRSAKILLARIGDRIRLTGLAEIGHRDFSVQSPAPLTKRALSMLDYARANFPRAAEWDKTEPLWAGGRPVTPQGLPIIGASALPGLFLNLGHGGLGWTLATGSAARLCRVIGNA